MSSKASSLVSAAVSVLLGASFSLAHDGEGGRRSLLAPPPDAPFPEARGIVELGHETFFLGVAGLAAGDYTVCLDDGTGTLSPVGTVMVEGDDGGDGEEGDGHGDGPGDGEDAGRGGEDGEHDDRMDAGGILRLGLDALPFGAENPLDLSGRAIAVKDAAGTVVLAGKTPSPIVEEPEEHIGECPLSRPDGAVDSDASGVLKLESGEGRMVIKVHLKNLDAGTVHEISITNPADGMTVKIGMVTINEEGVGQFKLDTEMGDAIPFGAQDLAALEGFRVEVKNEEGAVVLAGTVCPAEMREDGEPHGADEECEANLARPDPAPDADATGEVEIEGEELEVEVERLDPESSYDVVLLEPADGGASAIAGQVRTGERGRGEIEIEAREGEPLPFGKATISELVGFGIEIRDSQGVVVLAGAIPLTVCEEEEEDGEGDGHGDDREDEDDHGEDPPGADEPCEADLARPDPAPDADAEGEVEIEGDEVEVEVENLTPGTEYDVILIDPADGGASEAAGKVKAGEGGHGELEIEAREGVPLPFGKASAVELAGFKVEIRDPDGAVVLVGALPAIVCDPEREDGHEGDGEWDGRGDEPDDREGGGAGLPEPVDPIFVMSGSFDAPFLRGDANRDSLINISDSVSILRYLFAGAARPYCLDSSDANDDGRLDITDPIAILGHLFLGGPRPVSPGTLIPGSDPTSDGLYCEEAATP